MDSLEECNGNCPHCKKCVSTKSAHCVVCGESLQRISTNSTGAGYHQEYCCSECDWESFYGEMTSWHCSDCGDLLRKK